MYILNEFAGQTALIFTKTCNECERLTHLLRNLGFEVCACVRTHTRTHATLVREHLNFNCSAPVPAPVHEVLDLTWSLTGAVVFISCKGHLPAWQDEPGFETWGVGPVQVAVLLDSSCNRRGKSWAGYSVCGHCVRRALCFFVSCAVVFSPR